MKFWIGVASKDHVLKGIEGGFCQLGHGKMSAVRRLAAGDWIAYYSPRLTLDSDDPLQAFTAIGEVQPGEPYLFEMGNGFVLARRNVRFLKAKDAPIRPLINDLAFITNKKNWAYPFRLGTLSVSREDFEVIAKAMGAALPT
jgi:hypothetical protein